MVLIERTELLSERINEVVNVYNTPLFLFIKIKEKPIPNLISSILSSQNSIKYSLGDFFSCCISKPSKWNI